MWNIFSDVCAASKLQCLHVMKIKLTDVGAKVFTCQNLHKVSKIKNVYNSDIVAMGWEYGWKMEKHPAIFSELSL